MWTSLGLYLSVAILGILISKKAAISNKQYGIIQKVQLFVLMLLIFTMGVKIGADDRVISSLAEIGLSALVLTSSAMAGSIVFVLIARKILGINKKGLKDND